MENLDCTASYLKFEWAYRIKNAALISIARRPLTHGLLHSDLFQPWRAYSINVSDNRHVQTTLTKFLTENIMSTLRQTNSKPCCLMLISHQKSHKAVALFGCKVPSNKTKKILYKNVQAKVLFSKIYYLFQSVLLTTMTKMDANCQLK